MGGCGKKLVAKTWRPAQIAITVEGGRASSAAAVAGVPMADVAQQSNAREGHRQVDGAVDSRVQAENTYIETPQEYGKVCGALIRDTAAGCVSDHNTASQEFVFRQSRVKAILQSVLESILHGKTYHPTKGAQVCGRLLQPHAARHVPHSCPSKSPRRSWLVARTWVVCGTSCWCRCCLCRTLTKPSKSARGGCGTAPLMGGHASDMKTTTSSA